MAGVALPATMLAGSLLSSPTSDTNFTSQQFPGLTGTPEGQQIWDQLQAIFGSPGTSDSVGMSSAFQGPLQDAILNPQFGPTSESETAFLDSIMSLTQGQSSLRGLGPATQGGLAQNLAGPLMQLRNQQIGNLSGAFGQDIGIRGQDIDQRGQDLNAYMAERGMNIQGLLELAGLTMPQIIAGSETNTSSPFNDMLSGLGFG